MANDGGQRTSEERTVDPAGWVDRHGDGLYRYAILRLGDADRAADVVQETFLHALRSFDSFSGRSSERTWLIGILKHKVVDQLRASSRRQSLVDGLVAGGELRPEFDQAGHWRTGPRRWGAEVGREVETREFWDAFGSCLGKLPRTLADTFLLRELDGLGSDEVQQRLGISPANLWARLHRARSLLRQCLETGWFGDEPSATPLAPPTTANRKARPPDGPTP